MTDQARASIESRLKEAQEYHRQLEKKLLDTEKEKQGLLEEKRKAVVNLEQQVLQPPDTAETQSMLDA